MADYFIDILQDIRGTAVPGEPRVDGIYYDIVAKPTEDDGITPRLGNGLYGSTQAMHTSVIDNKNSVDASVIIVTDLRDQTITNAATAAASGVTATTAASDTMLYKWEAEAAKLTADSYATEAVDVFVNVVTSNGDGTFTATPTTEYSSLHYSTKAAELFGTSGAFTVELYDDPIAGNLSTTTGTGNYTIIGSIVHTSISIENINITGLTSTNVLYIRPVIPGGSTLTFHSLQNNTPITTNIDSVELTTGKTQVVTNIGTSGIITLQETGSLLNSSAITVGQVDAASIYINGSFIQA